MTELKKKAKINTPYIELCQLLKKEDLVASGGEAKIVISEGMVLVNGEIETRKRKKIVQGDIIVFGQTTLEVSKI